MKVKITENDKRVRIGDLKAGEVFRYILDSSIWMKTDKRTDYGDSCYCVDLTNGDLTDYDKDTFVTKAKRADVEVAF